VFVCLQQRARQVGVRVGTPRIQRRRAAERRDGLIRPAELGQHHANIVLQQGAGRHARRGTPVSGERLRQRSHGAQRIAQIEQRLRIIRLQRQGAAQRSHRLVRLAERQLRDAQVGPCGRIAGIGRQQAPVQPRRLVVPPGLLARHRLAKQIGRGNAALRTVFKRAVFKRAVHGSLAAGPAARVQRKT
jgi:hypothetical protein